MKKTASVTSHVAASVQNKLVPCQSRAFLVFVFFFKIDQNLLDCFDSLIY